MLVINRFRIPPAVAADFLARAEVASQFFRGRPGCLSVDVVQNLDEPELWALVSRWEDVGSYRRAFNGYDAKLALVPLLNDAVDEPSAYDVSERVGVNVPRDRD
ncbi:antibiotic biosynthesis monooxygenase family protein [Nigerium massiliense]|uniref:antibiotic biosynthesis monooxygenase family protein n=1 Tax=Nigerium massiliense TaxID=1522317 RepID=UPI00058B499F|nr:antibiotic biosynthesis monooxygenase family protein [Nigerium massiliense]